MEILCEANQKVGDKEDAEQLPICILIKNLKTWRTFALNSTTDSQLHLGLDFG